VTSSRTSAAGHTKELADADVDSLDAGVVSPYAAGANAVSEDGRIGFASVEFDQRANELPKTSINRVIEYATGARSPALEVEPRRRGDQAGAAAEPPC